MYPPGMRTTVLALLLILSACQDSTPVPAAPALGAAVADSAGEAKPDDDVDITSPKVPEDTWMAFTSDDGHYKVRFPSAPSKDTANVPTAAGDIAFTTHMAAGKDVQYGVMFGDFPADMMKDFNLDAGLDGARNGAVNNIGGTLLEEQQITFAGQPARAFSAKASAEGMDFLLYARVFMVGPRLFQMIVVHDAKLQGVEIDKFFDSFELVGS